MASTPYSVLRMRMRLRCQPLNSYLLYRRAATSPCALAFWQLAAVVFVFFRLPSGEMRLKWFFWFGMVMWVWGECFNVLLFLSMIITLLNTTWIFPTFRVKLDCFKTENLSYLENLLLSWNFIWNLFDSRDLFSLGWHFWPNQICFTFYRWCSYCFNVLKFLTAAKSLVIERVILFFAKLRWCAKMIFCHLFLFCLDSNTRPFATF